MSVVAADRLSMAYGHLPLLEEASLRVEAGERVCVVGRNGAGKSTLLRILAGEEMPDAGTVWRQAGLRIARLEQDVRLSTDRPVFDVAAEGLGTLRDLVTAYHRAASAAAHGSAAALERLGRLQHELEERGGWQAEQRVELVLSRLSLPPDAPVGTLSGGWRRRVLLARALVGEPDLLLLDEPTNHLDIEAIAWLEEFLASCPAAVVFVTHDRTFLQRLATRIVVLDRGRLVSFPGDYAAFLRRREEWLEAEAVEQEKFDRRLAAEEAWLRQGIKARRTRNEGRVRALERMRRERAARRDAPGGVRLHLEHGAASGRLVFEMEGLQKAYGGVPVVDGFSARVMRGDRVGLIGPNGSGKTTMLRLLLGETRPDQGTVRRGTGVQIAYYDQEREQLDPERTVADTVGDGNETVTVNGQARHVLGYLRDFLFPPERARSPVRALSGGERNRLLLARLFVRPANVLVLDEPTNDLDLETLEMLEARLVEWPGTLLLVSHDRAFLDNVVTSTWVFEGAGRVQEYVGGYADWVRQRAASGPVEARADRAQAPAARAAAAPPPPAARLTYRERRELEELPALIEDLEAEQAALTARVSGPGFYKEPAAAIGEVTARLHALEAALADAYARWADLEARSARSGSG